MPRPREGRKLFALFALGPGSMIALFSSALLPRRWASKWRSFLAVLANFTLHWRPTEGGVGCIPRTMYGEGYFAMNTLPARYGTLQCH